MEFVKPLQGTLADGSRVIISVYRVDRITIGKSCALRGVEVAVLPDADRPILGLRALRRLSPFQLSFEPPELALTGCRGGVEAKDPTPERPAASTGGAVAEAVQESSDVALGEAQR